MKFFTLLLSLTLLATTAHAGSKRPCPECPPAPRIILANGDSLSLGSGNWTIHSGPKPRVVTRWRTRTIHDTITLGAGDGIVRAGAGSSVGRGKASVAPDERPVAYGRGFESRPVCPPFHAPEIRCERTPWYAIAGAALGGVALGALLHHDTEATAIATASVTSTSPIHLPCDHHKHGHGR